jgi:hypothetical protein
MSQLVPVSKWCPTANTLTLNNSPVSSKQWCNINSSQGIEATSASNTACRLCRNHRIHLLLATRFLYPPLPPPCMLCCYPAAATKYRRRTDHQSLGAVGQWDRVAVETVAYLLGGSSAADMHLFRVSLTDGAHEFSRVMLPCARVLIKRVPTEEENCIGPQPSPWRCFSIHWLHT